MLQYLANYLQPVDPDIQALTVNLEKDFSHFSFTEHFPDKKHLIDELFSRSIEGMSVSSLLQSSELEDTHLNLFKRLGFKQLSKNPKTGVILEHPNFPGWLIKKNYSFQKEERFSKLAINTKVVRGSNFPDWMLPHHLKNQPKDKLISIKVPNDVINPLRVVMLKRGAKWIDRLKLTSIKAAQEYLYYLPTASSAQPFHQRVIVISKKENVLDASKSVARYAQLAQSNPRKLKQIAQQIALFIQHVKLTDSHLKNFLFLDDETNTVVAVDGEPVGGLADLSEPELVKVVQTFDPGFWALLGLKKLSSSISDQMWEEDTALEKILQVQRIFDAEIQVAINNITYERRWQSIKIHAFESSALLNIALFIIRSFSSSHSLIQSFNPHPTSNG